MWPEPGSVEALVVLIVATGIMIRVVMGGWSKRNDRGVSIATRLAQMEERLQKIEEATSGLVGEFNAVKERERFLRQLVEAKTRKEQRPASEVPLPVPAAPDPTSPFVVQTVSAARRTQ